MLSAAADKDERKYFIVTTSGNYFGVALSEEAYDAFAKDPALDNFLDDCSVFTLSAIRDNSGVGGNLCFSVKVVPAEGKENTLVFFKLRPEVITQDNLHSNVFVSSMVESPITALYHAIQKVYSPILLKDDSWSGKFDPKLQDLIAQLEAGLRNTLEKSDKLTRSGSKEFLGSMSVIMSPEEEVQFWSNIANTTRRKDEREMGKLFYNALEPLSKEFSTLESLPLSDVDRVLEAADSVLDDLWKLDEYPYPQHRMEHLMDVIGNTVTRFIQKKLKTMNFWEESFNIVEESLNKSISICDKWITSCERLTSLLWPNYTPHPWSGNPFSPTYTQGFASRLREVLQLRVVHRQLTRLLSCAEQEELKVHLAFAPLSGLSPAQYNRYTDPLWRSAVGQFERALVPVEERAAGKLRVQLRHVRANTLQLLQEFKRYRDVIGRPAARQMLAAEREGLLGALGDHLLALVSDFSSGRRSSVIQLIDMPEIIGTIYWVRQLECQVADIESTSSKLLDDLPGHKELQVVAGDLLRDLKEFHSDQFDSWTREIGMAIHNKKLSLQTDEPVVYFEQGKLMHVNYNPRLVGLIREVRQLAVLGYKIPVKIQETADLAKKFMRQAKALEQVANFHNTIGDRMIPSQRPMMLKAALELAQLVQEQNSVTWSDTAAVDRYISKLQALVERLCRENNKLNAYHAQIRDKVVQLMDTDLLRHQQQWKDILKDIRAIMSQVESQNFSNMRSWRAHWDHQLYKALEHQYQLGLEALDQHLPEIKIELVYRQQELQFRPPMEEIRMKYYGQLKRFLSIPNNFRGVSDSSDSHIFPIIIERNAERFRHVFAKAEELFSRLKLVRVKWHDCVALGSVDLNQLAEEHLSTAEHWERNFKATKVWSQEIAKLPSCDEKVECFSVSLLPVRAEMELHNRRYWDTLVSSLQSSVVRDVAAVEKFIGEATQVLNQQPSSVEEIGTASAKHSQIMNTAPEMFQVLEEVQRKNKTLASWTKEHLEQVNRVVTLWDNFQSMLDNYQFLISRQVEGIRNSLTTQVENLSAELEKFRLRWEQMKPREMDLQSAGENVLQRSLHILRDKRHEWGKLFEAREALSKDCIHFGMEPPELVMFEEIENDLKKHEEMWSLFDDFNSGLQNFAKEEWIIFRSKTYKFEEFLLEWQEKLKSSKETTILTVRLLQDVERYKEVLPLLKFVRGEIFSDKHWLEMFGLVGIPSKPIENLVFGDFLSCRENILTQANNLQDLNSRASSEIVIRQALGELDIWEVEAKFSLLEHKDSRGTSVMLIIDFKDILNKVGDNQCLLQSIKNSPNYNNFVDRASIWESRLADLDEFLHSLNQIQRKWVYLEPIFSAGTLTQDQARFQRIDQDFRYIMADVAKDQKVVSLCRINNLHQILNTLLDQLSRCQKSLNDFLEEKRSAFPRFCFLGDEDLLEILGQSTRHNVIQAHLKKLFSGIHAVSFDAEGSCITAMKSIDGETVPLKKQVKLVQQVEVWLAELASEMKSTLRQLLLDCVQEGERTKSDPDPSKYPSQVLCLAESVLFTRRCEEAISSGGLRAFLGTLQVGVFPHPVYPRTHHSHKLAFLLYPLASEQDDHRYAATYSSSINLPREQVEPAVTPIPAKSPSDSDEEQSEEEEFQGVVTAETSMPTAGTAAATGPAVNSMTTQPPRITDMSQLLQQLRLIIQIGQQTASQLNNLVSQQQEVQSNLNNLASQQQNMQANLTSQINSQNAEMRQHIDSKMDLLNSRLQEGLTELEERIETRLQDQSQSMTQLSEQVQTQASRVDNLETHTTTLVRVVDRARLEQQGHAQVLSERLEEVENTTALLKSRWNSVEAEFRAVAEKNSQSGDAAMQLQATQQKGGLPSNVTSVTSLTPTMPAPTTATTPAVNHSPQPRSCSPAHLDQVTLMHHPAKHWSESIPTFSGKSQENPIRFLKKFEDYARTFALTDTEKLKCLNFALKSTAFYWWELQSTQTTSFDQFKDQFKSQYWSLKVQGNLRAQLHADRFDSKRGGSLEAHIVTMYERTRYLDIVMSDEEFIATMLTQLPVAYQIQMSGHAYKDVTEFRDHVLAVDKLQRLQKGQASKEEYEKPSQPAYQKQGPVNTPWSIEQLDRTKWKPPCYIIKSFSQEKTQEFIQSKAVPSWRPSASKNSSGEQEMGTSDEEAVSALRRPICVVERPDVGPGTPPSPSAGTVSPRRRLPPAESGVNYAALVAVQSTAGISRQVAVRRFAAPPPCPLPWRCQGDSFQGAVHTSWRRTRAWSWSGRREEGRGRGEGDLRDLELKLKALLLDTIHHIGVVEELVARRVAAVDSWHWQRQLRFYINKSGVAVARMVDAEFEYTYEYQGNASKLVHTPLIDKCYLTLTQGMHMGLGGNPYGPAGTGKTESVKALGGLLGRQVLVFNCDEGIDVKSMGRIFIGLVKCGAWGCFDEFNRLEEATLSAVSMQIQPIQFALKNKHKVVRLLNEEISIDSNSGIFVTMNPAGKGYGGRQKLPDNLKQLFRPVVMSQPDNELIAEVILYSEGFRHAKKIGRKIVELFNLARTLLSAQQHYDWGLRALKTVLRGCGAALKARRRDGGPARVEQGGEAELAVQALRLNTMSKLTFRDRDHLDALVRDVFPGVPFTSSGHERLVRALADSYAELGLSPDDDQLRKCMELYEQLQQRIGVVIVGPSGSGKSTVCRLVKNALSKLGVVLRHHTINPKAMPRTQLLGHIDLDTRQWTDGVLTLSAQQVYSEPADVHSWIVCDGDVDPEWVESLNSVLDDNRLLTLPSGWRIQFGPNVNFIFETHDLSYASPATVSRMGMIFLSDEDMNIKGLVSSWLKTQVENTIRFLGQFIDDYFYKAVDWVVQRGELVVGTSLVGLVQSGLSQLHGVSTRAHFTVALVSGLGGNLTPPCRDEFAKQVFQWTGEFMPEGLHLQHLFYNASRDCVEAHTMDRADHGIATPTGPGELPLVPTPDVKKTVDVVSAWLRPETRQPFLVVGPQGCGKSLILNHCFSKLRATDVAVVHCSAQITPLHVLQKLNQVCMVISSNMGRVYRPRNCDHLILYFKDINLARPDKWGTSMLVSFLQQLITYRGFYDSNMEWVGLENFQIVGSMTADGGTGHTLTTRFTSITRIYAVSYPEKEQLQTIYNIYLTDIMSKCLPKHPVWKSSAKVTSLTSSMITVYQEVKTSFTAVQQNHYLFTPRDLTRWCFGLFRYNFQDEDKTVDAVLEAVIYEGMRLFRDKLVSEKEQSKFDTIVNNVFKSYWNMEAASECVSAMFFVTSGTEPSAVTGMLPTFGRPLGKMMEDDWAATVNQGIVQYCREGQALDVLVSRQFLELVASADHVLSAPHGSLLLAGRAATGRRAAVKVVSALHGARLLTLHVGHGYRLNNFRNDLKNMMQLAAVEGEQVYFVLEEHQLIDVSILDMINSLLLSGEVPGLYNQDELESVISPLKDVAAQDGFVSNLAAYFADRVRRNLHVVLVLDVTSRQFTEMCESNPAFYKECRVLWLPGWRAATLRSVPRLVVDRYNSRDPENARKKVMVNDDIVNGFVKIHSQAPDVLASPQKYVSFVQTYIHIYGTKIMGIEHRQKQLQAGVSKLTEARQIVDTLKVEANEQEKKLAEKQAKANAALQMITETMRSANTQKVEMESLKEQTERENQQLVVRKKAIDEELAEIEPLIQEARAAIGNIKSEALSEIRSLRAPPDIIRDILEGVLRLMGILDTSWNSMKTFLAKRGVKEDIRSLEARRITAESRQAVEKLLRDKSESFDARNARRASAAAAPLAAWVSANVRYSRVLEKIRPLEAEQSRLQGGLRLAEDEIGRLSLGLEDVDQRVAGLRQQLSAYTREAAEVEMHLGRAQETLAAAQGLVRKLDDEYRRWQEQLGELSEDRVKLPAFSLLAAACIVYLSASSEDARASVLSSWEAALGIGEFSLSLFLGSEKETLQWLSEGLPSGQLSIQNAVIILQTSLRPFIIDPSTCALEWLKKHLRDKTVEVTLQNSSRFATTLELAIRFGKVLIIQDVDFIEPMLFPVLRGEFINQGPRKVVQLGDKLIDYNDNFQLFFTSRNVNPELSPSSSAVITVVNFTMTQATLADQLLASVLRLERPELEQRRVDLMRKEEELKLKVDQLQEVLLHELANAQGDILQNKELLSSLNEAKANSAAVHVSLSESKRLQAELEQECDVYRPLAESGSRLFFVINELRKVNAMYQFSEASFTRLFHEALKLPEDGAKSDVQMQDYQQRLEHLVYYHVTRALFKADHLLLALHLVRHMHPSHTPDDEWDVFTGLAMADTKLDVAKVKEVVPKWIEEERQFDVFVLKTALPALYSQLLLEDAGAWQAFWTSAECEGHFPVQLARRLSPFQQVLLVQALRPDRLRSALAQMAARVLGQFPRQGSWSWCGKLELQLLCVFTGGAVVEKLDHSPPTQTVRVRFPVGLDTDFRKWGTLWTLPWHVSFLRVLPSFLRCSMPHLTSKLAVNDRSVPRAEHYVWMRVSPALKDLSPSALNLRQLLSRTLASEPVLLLISPGADPSEELRCLARASVGGDRYHEVALGEGQVGAALERLRAAARAGDWLCLKNLHLMVSWLPALEKEIRALQPHQDFRLWLTSEPHPGFPPILAQQCLKITYEAPRGVKRNLLQIYTSWGPELKPASVLHGRSLFALAWFHAVLLERRTFIPQGWAKFYEFSDADLRMAREALQQLFGKGAARIDWEFIHGLYENAIYGGHVDNMSDIRVVASYLQELFNTSVLEDGSMSLGPGIRIPSSTNYKDYLEVIQELSDVDKPQYFGLPENVERSLERVTSRKVINQLKSLKRPVEGKTKFDRDEWQKQLTPVLNLWKKLNQGLGFVQMKVAALAEGEDGAGPPPQPVAAFVGAEFRRGVLLVQAIHRSLAAISKVVRGSTAPRPDLAELAAGIMKHQTPPQWQREWGGPAEPLPYLRGVVARVLAVQRWGQKSEQGALLREPLDLADLFRPGVFLCALKQQTARGLGVVLDELVLLSSWSKNGLPGAHLPVVLSHLQLEGASLDGPRLVPNTAGSPSVGAAPPCTVAWMPRGGAASYSREDVLRLPLYETASRESEVVSLDVPCPGNHNKWIQAGVAFFLRS
ncbi:cytoplasmic dynein 2 heavy chain 1 [Bacillus rossius redtenbacheri]|uniref:cytoplasmic dynein 2 heavy chain 1 n=1 Tax=Bacillus rossius redtenbacheri TaxID=93214 RepID=UPI002FDCFCC3